MSLKNPKSGEWKTLWCVSSALDVAQWGIDFIPGVGEVINEILDPIIGVSMAAYFQIRGISMTQRIDRLLSLIGGYLAEAFSASVAPAWVMDVWYIHRSIKQEWAAQQATLEEAQAAENPNAPLNRMVSGSMRRQPRQQERPANQGGRRSPRSDIRPLQNTPTVGQA